MAASARRVADFHQAVPSDLPAHSSTLPWRTSEALDGATVDGGHQANTHLPSLGKCTQSNPMVTRCHFQLAQCFADVNLRLGFEIPGRHHCNPQTRPPIFRLMR